MLNTFYDSIVVAQYYAPHRHRDILCSSSSSVIQDNFTTAQDRAKKEKAETSESDPQDKNQSVLAETLERWRGGTVRVKIRLDLS